MTDDLRGLAAYDHIRDERPTTTECLACLEAIHLGAFCSLACSRAADERESARRAKATK